MSNGSPNHEAQVTVNAIVKPYFLPLKAEYYLKFKCGEQNCEIRPANYRGWREKNIYAGRELLLSLGYSKADRHCRKIRVTVEGPASFAFAGVPDWHVAAVEQIYGKRGRWLVAYVD